VIAIREKQLFFNNNGDSKEVTTDAVKASVKSELESISSLKEEQRTAQKAFLSGKNVFASSPD